jgi:hypothetical protein
VVSLAALDPKMELPFPITLRLGGHKAFLEDMEKRKFIALLGLEPRPLDRPARSQSLHGLHSPDYFIIKV